MSRFLKIMIVLLTIAAVATPVMAEDRLSLGGEMRVRGYYSDWGGDHTSTTLDQRLRLLAKINVAEGVRVTFRTDVSEGKWGSDKSFGRFNSIQDVDRAYLDLWNDNLAFRAGTYNLVVNEETIDSQDTGMMFTIKGAVPVSIFYQLTESNGDNADGHLFGVDATVKNDAFSVTPVAAVQIDSLRDNEEVYLLGATVNAKVGAVALTSELDYFTGDYNAKKDAVGTQFRIDGSVAATERLTVGGAFYYALGADKDEEKYSYLGNDFNGWDPLMYGPLSADAMLWQKRAYDVFGNGGVIALQVYGSMKATDDLDFTASAAYAEPENDDTASGIEITDDLSFADADSAMIFTVGSTYALMSNTKLMAQAQYVDYDADIEGTTDSADSIVSAEVKLSVKF